MAWFSRSKRNKKAGEHGDRASDMADVQEGPVINDAEITADQEAPMTEPELQETREKIRALLEAEYAEIEAAAERSANESDPETQEKSEPAEAEAFETLEEIELAETETVEAQEETESAEAEDIEAPEESEPAEIETVVAQNDAGQPESNEEPEPAETDTLEAQEECEPEEDGASEVSDDSETEAPDMQAGESKPQSFVWLEDEVEAERQAEKKEKYERPLPAAVVSPSKYIKPAYVPKTALGRKCLRDRHTMTLAAAILLLAVFAGLQAYDYLVPKTVDISFTTFDGTQQAEYRTTARTVGAMIDELTGQGDAELAAAGISIADTDVVDLDENRPIANDLPVSILQATKTTARISGKKQEVWLVPGTVEDNLALNGITYDDDDEIKPALDKEVGWKTNLVVDEVHYDIDEKTETIEAVSRVILDPSLTSGVQQTEEGNDGEGIFTYTTRYVNGKNKGTERELKEWIIEPHDHMLRLGTASTGHSGEYTVARTFIANTTAYTARPGARGALGMVVHVGTCAVDPSFVSLRSELWVEGYGYAYAMDTGGAVRGNVVDLYMSSNAQCVRWGRRNMVAYVLGPAE